MKLSTLKIDLLPFSIPRQIEDISKNFKSHQGLKTIFIKQTFLYRHKLSIHYFETFRFVSYIHLL